MTTETTATIAQSASDNPRDRSPEVAKPLLSVFSAINAVLDAAMGTLKRLERLGEAIQSSRLITQVLFGVVVLVVVIVVYYYIDPFAHASEAETQIVQEDVWTDIAIDKFESDNELEIFTIRMCHLDNSEGETEHHSYLVLEMAKPECSAKDFTTDACKDVATSIAQPFFLRQSKSHKSCLGTADKYKPRLFVNPASIEYLLKQIQDGLHNSNSSDPVVAINRLVETNRLGTILSHTRVHLNGLAELVKFADRGFKR